MNQREYKQSYLRDWIYGGVDGVVTTFAVVAGVAGANLSIFVVLVLGFANLIVDGFSMAVSNYLGTKSELERIESQSSNRVVDKSPLQASFYTFCSFVIFGLTPLIPYILSFPRPLLSSCVMTGVVFFLIGSGKSFWTKRSWIYSGLETFVIGSIAASLAYIVAYLLRRYVS